MKVMTRVIQEVEMQMPLHGAEVSKAGLRTLRDEWGLEAREGVLRRGADATVEISMVLFCDADQRGRVSLFPGFVPAEDYPHAARLDFGAWENFRFKWSHE